MTSVTRYTLRRALAVTVAVAAGSGLAGTASAQDEAAAKIPSALSAPLTTGMYQTAYSERNHVLWATTAVGRPPVTNSKLLKLDPETLQIKASYTPPVTDAGTGAVEAVYGIDVDDEHNTLWVTNTRDNSVAVYSQATGEHLATLPDVGHAREVKVDERRDTVWATSYGTGSLVAFDSATFKEKQRYTVEGSGPTGVAVNEKTRDLYANDLTNNRLIELDPADGSVRFLPAGAGDISVALSRNGHTAYTANQTDGTVSVIDVKKGTLVRTVATGAGALSVAVDRSTNVGKVVVANRVAATVTVLTPNKDYAARTVAVHANPNHVQIADGTAYVVDKSGAGPAGEDFGYAVDLG